MPSADFRGPGQAAPTQQPWHHRQVPGDQRQHPAGAGGPGPDTGFPSSSPPPRHASPAQHGMRTNTVVSLAWSAAHLLQCCLPCQHIHDHQSIPAQPSPAAEDSQKPVCTLLISHLMQPQEHCVTGHSIAKDTLNMYFARLLYYDCNDERIQGTFPEAMLKGFERPARKEAGVCWCHRCWRW